MKKLILLCFLIIAASSFAQEAPPYHPEDRDEYEIEQQRLEHEERMREAQMLREMEPPVDTYDNSGEYGY